jgi:DNA-binding MarR family transcriptional regulator
LVDRLFAAGLVTRGGDPKDRRVVRVEITLKGRALVERLRAARHDAMRRLVEDLTEEQVDQVLAAMPALGRLAGLPAAATSPAVPRGAGSEGALAPRPPALR